MLFTKPVKFKVDVSPPEYSFSRNYEIFLSEKGRGEIKVKAGTIVKVKYGKNKFYVLVNCGKKGQEKNIVLIPIFLRTQKLKVEEGKEVEISKAVPIWGWFWYLIHQYKNEIWIAIFSSIIATFLYRVLPLILQKLSKITLCLKNCV